MYTGRHGSSSKTPFYPKEDIMRTVGFTTKAVFFCACLSACCSTLCGVVHFKQTIFFGNKHTSCPKSAANCPPRAHLNSAPRLPSDSWPRFVRHFLIVLHEISRETETTKTCTENWDLQPPMDLLTPKSFPQSHLAIAHIATASGWDHLTFWMGLAPKYSPDSVTGSIGDIQGYVPIYECIHLDIECIYIYIHIHTHVCMNELMYVCMHACTL